MNNRFFSKLAASNIKKNGKAYIPYILSCVMTVALFYIVKSLSYNPGLKNMVGSSTMMTMMSMCSVIIALFAIVFLFYTNSFLMKRRKKEFGVFNILGMEKSHIAKTMAWENFYVTLISIVGGLVIGIALDKAMFLLIAQVLNEEISLGFFISDKAIISTILMFCVIFLLILTIYFGSGYYGIYDAAKGYFGKEASELNEYEAVMLAGLLNAPSAYSPDTSPELAKQRMRQLLDRMVECEVTDQTEADNLLAQSDK